MQHAMSVSTSCCSGDSFLSEATCAEVPSQLEGPFSLDSLVLPDAFFAAGSSVSRRLDGLTSQHEHCAITWHSGVDGTDQESDHLRLMFRQQMLLEARLQPNHTGMDAGVRMIVVSWMVEVAEEFRLQQETLHMAVLLLDRFLASAEGVPRCVLQLLAVGCVLLAAKDLEVSQPTVEQLCAVTANHFKPHDVLRMERIILNELEFRLSGPSCYTFLHLLAQASSTWVTPAVLSLAMYLGELAMLDAQALTYSYSSLAASALLLAQLCVGSTQHTPFIEAAVRGCMDADSIGLTPCMAMLLRLQQIAYHHTAAALTAASGSVVGAAPASPDGDAGMADSAYFATTAAAAGVGSTTGTGAEDVSTGAYPTGQEQPGDLLTPLRVKFGADCWCGVSLVAPPTFWPGQA